MSHSEDFQVIIASKTKDDDTIILTSQEQTQKWLENAMFNFNNNYHQYSTYLNENSLGKAVITNEEIDSLADNPQNDIHKVKRINGLAKYYINKDDLIGKIYETIESNINTNFKLSYSDFSGNRNKLRTLENAKSLIKNFNRSINLKQLLRKSIPISYAEGNFISYLRTNTKGNYVVDHFPLGVAEISDYEIDGEPIVLINVSELVSRLKKTVKKKKNGSNLFFDNIEDELKNNYPIEVFDAYKAKDQYAKLNVENTGVIRVNNINRKYGVTPIFRTFKSAVMLDTFENTDRINAKAKGKKIIFQKLRKELLGQDGQSKAFEEMAYAHDTFMQAWKSETVIYTGAAFVEDIKYIEPTVETTNISNISHYRSKIMTALGIGFLNQDSKQTFTVANISILELMKTINKISEQLEDILEKWYCVLLLENDIPLEYCPEINIIDAEMLSNDIKLSLIDILFSKMNLSYETSLGLFGISVSEEKQRRIKENKEGFEEIFTPRLTSYTSNGDSTGGRPVDNKNPDKQVEDQDRRGSE